MEVAAKDYAQADAITYDFGDSEFTHRRRFGIYFKENRAVQLSMLAGKLD
jgi:hypothetical protein